jgi:hypothetical protein
MMPAACSDVCAQAHHHHAARACPAAADGHCEKREVSGREVCVIAYVAIFQCGSELRLI